MQNEILRSAWTKALAKELSLSEEALTAEMKKNSSRTVLNRQAAIARSAEPARENLSQAVSAAEKMILGLALESPDFAGRIREELAAPDFESPAARKIMERFFQEASGTALSAKDLMILFQSEPEVITFISQVSADVEVVADKEKVLSDCLVQMKRQRIRTARGGLLAQMATAEKAGDQGRINEFKVSLHELNKREKKINEKK